MGSESSTHYHLVSFVILAKKDIENDFGLSREGLEKRFNLDKFYGYDSYSLTTPRATSAHFPIIVTAFSVSKDLGL